jgi:formylglycine-generating enzyme required for sulfatase activity
MGSLFAPAVRSFAWCVWIASACLAAGACADHAGDGPGGGTSSGSSGGSGTSGGAGGSDGGGDAFTPPPDGPGARCASLAPLCGGSHDCCAATAVPGGTYDRANDPEYPATISGFAFDVYEVTVGRFRAFVNAGKGTQADPPAVGAGAHPKIPGSGWLASFTAELPATTADLRSALACDPAYPIWTDAPGGNEYKPMTCVSWWEALAFCAWDGGRLPTEAEWNYAASGGSEQRTYPWGPTIDPTKASFDCTGDGSGAQDCAFTDIVPVGSFSPQGDGRWGHADLVGNVWEWVLDYYVTPLRLKTCTDCADLEAPPNGWRTFRGGSFRAPEYLVKGSDRLANEPTRQFDIGLRCARAAN